MSKKIEAWGGGQWLVVVEYLVRVPNTSATKNGSRGSGSWAVLPHTFNPSCRKAEADGSRFESSQGYTEENVSWKTEGGRILAVKNT